MKVDFPAPFGPVKPYFRPDENVVVTSSKRIFDPKRMDTPLTVIMNLRLYAIALSLALRVARHPSEWDEYLVTRLLAYLLEFTERIA